MCVLDPNMALIRSPCPRVTSTSTGIYAPKIDGKYTNKRPTRSWLINDITRIDNKESDEKVPYNEQEQDVWDVWLHVIVGLILHPPYKYGGLATKRSYERRIHTTSR